MSDLVGNPEKPVFSERRSNSSISKMSNLLLVSVAAWTGACLTWSKTMKTVLSVLSQCL